MTAEGDDVEPELIVITQCEPPFRFAGDTSVGDDTWHLRFELNHEDGYTTVIFAQVVGDDLLASIGPGWEYYLARLAAVLESKKQQALTGTTTILRCANTTRTSRTNRVLLKYSTTHDRCQRVELVRAPTDSRVVHKNNY